MTVDEATVEQREAAREDEFKAGRAQKDAIAIFVSAPPDCDAHAVLRLRSLVARKRAKTANPLFTALFASPNEIVWHVLSFWRVRIP